MSFPLLGLCLSLTYSRANRSSRIILLFFRGLFLLGAWCGIYQSVLETVAGEVGKIIKLWSELLSKTLRNWRHLFEDTFKFPFYLQDHPVFIPIKCHKRRMTRCAILILKRPEACLKLHSNASRDITSQNCCARNWNINSLVHLKPVSSMGSPSTLLKPLSRLLNESSCEFNHNNYDGEPRISSVSIHIRREGRTKSVLHFVSCLLQRKRGDLQMDSKGKAIKKMWVKTRNYIQHRTKKTWSNDFLMILSTAQRSNFGGVFYYVQRKFLIIRSRHDALKYIFFLCLSLLSVFGLRGSLHYSMHPEKKYNVFVMKKKASSENGKKYKNLSAMKALVQAKTSEIYYNYEAMSSPLFSVWVLMSVQRFVFYGFWSLFWFLLFLIHPWGLCGDLDSMDCLETFGI